MQKLRIDCFSVSIDGFGAGVNQSLENPLGVGGLDLHQWFFPTRAFQQQHQPDSKGGTTGIDNDFAVRGFENIGAWIIGRNMFGPVRGPWLDEDWKGWWGENPPYHVPVFVLTHHKRPSLTMEGGTTFHFVTTGIRDALEYALTAANGKDVRLGGGVSTIRQFLHARLVDEIHFAISPVLLGAGENLFENIDLVSLGYQTKSHASSEKATHIIISRKSEDAY